MMISMVIIMSSRAEASGKRIVEVLNTNIDITDRKADGSEAVQSKPSGKVEFKDVSFKYSLTGTV